MSPGSSSSAPCTRTSPSEVRTSRTPPAFAMTRPRSTALLLHTFHVRVRARIDLDQVADVDEQRDRDLRAGLDRRGLLDVARGVTADAGLRGGDLEEHERRQRDVDRALVEEQHAARQVVLHEVGRLADQLARDRDLLVALLVHEDQVVAFLVEELHLALLDVGRLELLAGPDVPLDDGAGEEVLELRPRERGPLAGLDELELDDGVRVPVDEDLETLADV